MRRGLRGDAHGAPRLSPPRAHLRPHRSSRGGVRAERCAGFVASGSRTSARGQTLAHTLDSPSGAAPTFKGCSVDRCSGFGRVFLIIRSPEACERCSPSSAACGATVPAVSLQLSGTVVRRRGRSLPPSSLNEKAPIVIPLQRNSSLACISPSICLSPDHDFSVPRPARYIY